LRRLEARIGQLLPAMTHAEAGALKGKAADRDRDLFDKPARSTGKVAVATATLLTVIRCVPAGAQVLARICRVSRHSAFDKSARSTGKVAHACACWNVAGFASSGRTRRTGRAVTRPVPSPLPQSVLARCHTQTLRVLRVPLLELLVEILAGRVGSEGRDDQPPEFAELFGADGCLDGLQYPVGQVGPT
jgi:hypothetical protein